MQLHKNGPIVFIFTPKCTKHSECVCMSSAVILKPFFTATTLSLNHNPLCPPYTPPHPHPPHPRGNEWRNCEGHGGFERRRRGSPQRSTRITGVISHCRYRSVRCCCPTSLCGVRISLPTLSVPVSLCVYMYTVYSACSRHTLYIY